MICILTRHLNGNTKLNSNKGERGVGTCAKISNKPFDKEQERKIKTYYLFTKINHNTVSWYALRKYCYNYFLWFLIEFMSAKQRKPELRIAKRMIRHING